MSDLQSFLEYRNDPLVAQYQPWTLPITKKQAQTFIKEQIHSKLGVKGKWHQVAMELRENAAHIGECGIHTVLDGRQVEIGITIARNYQNKGIGFEVLEKLFEYLFNLLHIHRITTLVDAQNKSSLRLMEKLGMRREAYYKESYFTGPQWTDEVQFALLEKEFSLK